MKARLEDELVSLQHANAKKQKAVSQLASDVSSLSFLFEWKLQTLSIKVLSLSVGFTSPQSRAAVFRSTC